jgi:hypothetical protein
MGTPNRLQIILGTIPPVHTNEITNEELVTIVETVIAEIKPIMKYLPSETIAEILATRGLSGSYGVVSLQKRCLCPAFHSSTGAGDEDLYLGADGDVMVFRLRVSRPKCFTLSLKGMIGCYGQAVAYELIDTLQEIIAHDINRMSDRLEAKQRRFERIRGIKDRITCI